MLPPFSASEESSPFEDFRAETACIHESSYVDAPCRIGNNTRILHFTHVMAHSIIGDDCHIGHNVTIASGVLIGNAVKVLNNSLLQSGTILEDKVYCGPSTVFASLNHIRGKASRVSPVSPTLVRYGANIGANSTIASGVTIGKFTFVEAGSVVDKSIPDFCLAYGNPIRLLGWRCGCGQPLKFSAEIGQCKNCGQRYQQTASRKIIPLDNPYLERPDILANQ